jgi:hypothetical protein
MTTKRSGVDVTLVVASIMLVVILGLTLNAGQPAEGLVVFKGKDTLLCPIG